MPVVWCRLGGGSFQLGGEVFFPGTSRPSPLRSVGYKLPRTVVPHFQGREAVDGGSLGRVFITSLLSRFSIFDTPRQTRYLDDRSIRVVLLDVGPE